MSTSYVAEEQNLGTKTLYYFIMITGDLNQDALVGFIAHVAHACAIAESTY